MVQIDQTNRSEVRNLCMGTLSYHVHMYFQDSKNGPMERIMDRWHLPFHPWSPAHACCQQFLFLVKHNQHFQIHHLKS
jgi:hypothetical protein